MKHVRIVMILTFMASAASAALNTNDPTISGKDYTGTSTTSVVCSAKAETELFKRTAALKNQTAGNSATQTGTQQR